MNMFLVVVRPNKIIDGIRELRPAPTIKIDSVFNNEFVCCNDVLRLQWYGWTVKWTLEIKWLNTYKLETPA